MRSQRYIVIPSPRTRRRRGSLDKETARTNFWNDKKSTVHNSQPDSDKYHNVGCVSSAPPATSFPFPSAYFTPARCSCSRAPAHHPDHPHEEGDPHPREPPFPFRHFLFAFCFSMYLAILLSGARQKFFKSSSSLFAPSSSSLSPVPPQ